MTHELKVPRLAESISEAVVVAWNKPDGAQVRVDEPVVTLETDKAAVEIPSEFAGVLRHARAIGERVEVGDVLARIEEGVGTANVAPLAPQASDSPPAAMPPLSPAVRRMVEEHGVDPATIPATGPPGRLLKEDVQRVLQGPRPSPAPVPPSRSSEPPARAPASPPRAWEPPAPPRSRETAMSSAAAPAPPASFAPTRAPTDWKADETERAVPMS